MTSYYQSIFPGHQSSDLKTAEGEPIYTGPYTAAQAPFLECAACGGAITVGQRVTLVQEVMLAITHSGKLMYLPLVDFPEQAFVHSDCSSDFAHDQITKEPCEKDEDTYCAGCEVKLGGESE